VHANITVDQPAFDVSPANDWSEVRIYWPPAGELGRTIYGAFGFIRPDKPATHDALAAKVARATLIAVNP
jgi:hypothetical protein